MKKLLTILSIICLSLSLVACSSTKYESGTYTARVDEIDGTKISVTLGEIEEETKTMEMPNNDGASNMPSGDNAGTPPEKPDGDTSKMPEQGNAFSGDNGSAPEMSNNNGTPPEKPDGEAQDNNGNAPEKPDGDTSGMPNDAPDMSSGNMPSLTSKSFVEGEETMTFDLKDIDVTLADDTIGSVSDLSVDDVVEIVVLDDGKISSVTVIDLSSNDNNSGGMPSGNNGSGEIYQGTSANTISEDTSVSDESYSSTGDDENALRVDGATVNFDGISVNKESGSTSSPENGDFYGINAAILATNGATVTISNADIKSSAQSGNGVFSYGTGTTVNISDSTIVTTKDNSGGIQTTGGATTNASNLNVTTSGNSSAAIRSDRGGGTVNVDGGTYTSNGYNSPAVYSTADITISDATLTANNSESLVIEGENSINISDSTISGNMSSTEGTSSSTNVHNILVYQSMSGDADVGTANLLVSDSTLTNNNGDLIFVTNTDATITLENVDIIDNTSGYYLLNIAGTDRWGDTSSNGGNVIFKAIKQVLNGDIVVDSISTLDFTLSDGSTFTGTMNIVTNSNTSTSVSNNICVTIESGSTWNLTGDCTISSLVNSGTINFNGYTITLADGTVLSA